MTDIEYDKRFERMREEKIKGIRSVWVIAMVCPFLLTFLLVKSKFF